MAKHEIPVHLVGKVDRDLATARTNLALHVQDVRGYLNDGDAPETVFSGFAAHMNAADVPRAHLAVMLAAAVLTLTERETEDQVFPDAPWMYDFYFWGSGKTGDVKLMHRACHRCIGVIPPELELGFAHAGKFAELHLQGCQA